MKMKTKKTTFLKRISFPIIMILLFQSGLYGFFFWATGLFRVIEDNAIDVYNEQALVCKQNIEQQMANKWSNISDSKISIEKIIDVALLEKSAKVEDIDGIDVNLNLSLIDRVVPTLVSLLRENTVSGAFVILDGPGKGIKGYNCATVYLRDTDITKSKDDNSDLVLLYGNENISKNNNIKKDKNWLDVMSFINSGQEASEMFFYRPLTAYKLNNENISKDYGYWSSAFKANNDTENVLTYSVPLISSDGVAYGVMGIEVSKKLFFDSVTLIDIQNKQSNISSTAFLGVSEKNGTYNSCFAKGDLYNKYFSETNKVIVSKNIRNEYNQLKASDDDINLVYGSVQTLSIYNEGSAFRESNWVYMRIIENEKLLKFSNDVKYEFAIAVIVCLMICIIGAYFVSRMMARPISELVSNLKKSDPNKPVSLERINITEIDELTTSIENLSKSVAESSSKVSGIMALSKVPVGVFEYSGLNDYVYCSKNIFYILGWDIVTDDDNPYMPRDLFFKQIEDLNKYLVDQDKNIYKLTRPNGDIRWIQMKYIDEDGRTVGTVSDITKDMHEKQKIEYERDYDLLTGLYNRRAFFDNMKNIFANASDKCAAFMMWDLDNLKHINDTFGHDSGDRYICAFAECLKEFYRYNAIVSRFSGDEFMVMLYGYESKNEMRTIIKEVWKFIQNTVLQMPDGTTSKVRASGGIAWYPDDSVIGDELVRYADYAMYKSKKNEKGTYQEFNYDDYNENSTVLNGQERLSLLIENQLVFFLMQPIFSVKEAKVYGYEFLMRSEIEGLKSCREILRMARMNFRLYAIEQMTFFIVMQSYIELIEKGLINEDHRVFINSIASQMLTATDIKKFADSYKEYLHNIVIDITESEPSNKEYLENKIELTRGWEAQIAIDDYGTGYDSEASLVRMSPDFVKIDMSIVRGIDKDINRQNVLEGLIFYARKKNISIIAEGVETEQEMRVLVEHGVDYLQGYYIGKPSTEIQAINQNIIDAIIDARNSRYNEENI